MPRHTLCNGKLPLGFLIGVTCCTLYLSLLIHHTATTDSDSNSRSAATTRWMGLTSDNSKATFATVNPTGAYKYDRTKGCAKHAFKQPCKIYFPMIEMSNFIVNDELRSSTGDSTKDRMEDPKSEITFVETNDNEQATLTPMIIKSLNIPHHNDEQQAVLTRRGFKGEEHGSLTANQDRILIVSPFWVNQETSPATVVALFDGHGKFGHVVSHHAALKLPTVLSTQLEKRTLISEREVRAALTETILDIDRTLLDGLTSGSTAIIILKLGRKVYIANTGDSLAFLAAYSPENQSVEIIYSTQPHKPHLPDERERIEKAGGTVMIPNSGDMQSSRVVIPYGERSALALAMSRSIGDSEGAKIGVIANPTIDVIDLDEVSKLGTLKLFAVAATDGIFDLVKPPEVAEHISSALYGERRSLLQACGELILRASLLWKGLGLQYRDDISIAVTQL